jgi:hypothetical protein
MHEPARREHANPSDSVTLHYASPLPPETRESKLSIASVILPIAGSPCLVAPVLGGVGVPHQVLDGVMIVLLIASVSLPVAALIRIGLSDGTRTGIGWSICGLVTALIQLAISFILSI